MTAAAGPAPGPATDTVESPAALPATKPRGMFRRGLEVFLENKLAIVGVVLLVLIFGFCFLGPLFYHTDQVHVNLANENLAPGPGHPLGTDQNGYDILGRLMAGGQISLEVGLAAALLATVVGTLWGAIAGYFGGVTDSIMMRIVDALLAIPTLFLALVVVAIWPPTETELILVIALTSWLTTSRLIRGEALSLRVRDYVQAMRVMGGGSARAVFRHIAPNAIGTIIVNATFQVADAILLIVALSYLGLGIRPPQTDWGGMLSAGLNSVYDGYWWQIFPAGIAIILVVIAINFIGDALRDAFEVRLQQRLSSLLGGVFLLAPLLSIDDLRTEIRLRHGVVHAIDGVSLTVNPGECLGIVGESGSGKTMTALSIMRLLPGGGSVVGGTISVDGVDVTSLSESGMEDVRGNLIGMIFQDPLTSLNPTMAIGEQIAESVRLHRGASKAAALNRAVEVLGLVGMPKPAERISNYPHQLSGGMRQRVMIAMALACEPKLLIADEPTTALDVTIQKQILELIDSLRQRLSMAVILVTHDLGVIAGRADRVAVMYAGRIVESAPTPVLFARPRHPYTEALFEALPEKAADGSSIKRLYNIPGQPPDLTSPPPGCKFAPRCRYAQDSCRASEPALTDAGGAHFFRCFFPVGSAQEARDPGTPFVSVPPERPEVPGTPAAELAAGSAAGGAAAEEAAGGLAVASADGALLSVSHLVKNFTVTAGAVLQRKVGQVSAVADVSFGIPAGSTFGLVGESGCGKTTVGRLIVGLEKPSGGSIVLGGRDLASLSRRQRRRQARAVQLMFQDSYASMDPRMRVGTILREPLVIQRDGSRASQAKRVNAMLDEVGLPAVAAERYPHEFSGGQRQRLGLARALMLRPSMIVADEPVSALDVSIQAQILNLMLDLQRDYGLTYLFISHDLSVVRYMSDTIGVMYLGKLVEVGPAADVYAAPVHPYTRGLIDTVPVADPTMERAKEHQGVQGELPSAVAPPSGCRFRTRCP
ncbi:MAG: peptide/nickel transport system ATP-binding protein ddpF, partial [Trebonia sp.]|nr:peptide/nickel transport system ATP-binding protein ddpF [Trebonia sp.]